MSAEPLVDCPECKQPTLVKLIGAGAAVIVRGTETPCHGGRKLPAKGKMPSWRDGPVDKRILKNPKKYIAEGEI